MASSGIIGTPASGTRPYLQIHWRTLERDIANNRTKIRLDLRLYSQGNVSFSGSKTVSLMGSTTTFNGGFSGSNANKLIRTRDVWVTHNAMGEINYYVHGWFDIKINYSGSWIERLEVDGGANLDSIPRRSGITSFDLGSRYIHPNETNTVTTGVSRAHPSFSHQIYLYYGSKEITNWSYGANVAIPTTLDLSLANVRYILNLNSRNTSFTLRLELETFSNGVSMGRSGSWERYVHVHDDVAPSVNDLKASILGKSTDYDLGKFVEGFSRVNGTFDVGGSYGATIEWAEITMRRLTGGGEDDQTFAGYKATTSYSGNSPEIFRYGGYYRLVGYVRDSRGRTGRDYIDIYVDYYTQPKVEIFTVRRSKTNGLVVNVHTKTEWSDLGGINNLSMVIEHKLTTGTQWTGIFHFNDKTGSFESIDTVGSISENNSYDFRLRVKDYFSNGNTIEVPVSTSKTPLDIFEDIGIGVGKFHEFGVLDVGGDIYQNSELLDDIYHAGNTKVVTTDRGKYMKLPNGILLQWGHQKGTISTSAFGSMQYGQLIATAFPVGFAGTPDLVIPVIYDNNHIGVAYDSVNSTRVYRWLIYGATARSNYSLGINWFALGRWK